MAVAKAVLTTLVLALVTSGAAYPNTVEEKESAENEAIDARDEGAVKVALRGLHGQVDMETMDTSEDEKLDTRDEGNEVEKRDDHRRRRRRHWRHRRRRGRVVDEAWVYRPLYSDPRNSVWLSRLESYLHVLDGAAQGAMRALREHFEVVKRDASEKKTLKARTEKLFRRLFHGAYNGAMKAMHEQGEIEKRDAPEDETEDARHEVEVEKKDAPEDETLDDRDFGFWDFIHRAGQSALCVVHHAVQGVFGVVHGKPVPHTNCAHHILSLVEMDKRDAPEDEAIAARDFGNGIWHVLPYKHKGRLRLHTNQVYGVYDLIHGRHGVEKRDVPEDETVEARDEVEVEKRDAPEDETVDARDEASFLHNILPGFVRGQPYFLNRHGLIPERRGVEKRGVPEDETVEARDEVEVEKKDTPEDEAMDDRDLVELEMRDAPEDETLDDRDEARWLLSLVEKRYAPEDEIVDAY